MEKWRLNFVLHRIIILLILSTFFSCSPTKKLGKKYFQSNKEVGVLLKFSEFQITKQHGAIGLTPIDLAINYGVQRALNSVSDERSTEVCSVVNQMNPELKSRILKLFEQVHHSQRKTYKILNVNLDSLHLLEHEPTFMRRKQAFLDYRPIGKLYEIDELLIIDVRNFIELDGFRKNIVSSIKPLVIDMEDNSFMYASKFSNSYAILGNWRESPHYTKLLKIINSNVDKVVMKIEQQLIKNY